MDVFDKTLTGLNMQGDMQEMCRGDAAEKYVKFGGYNVQYLRSIPNVSNINLINANVQIIQQARPG